MAIQKLYAHTKHIIKMSSRYFFNPERYFKVIQTYLLFSSCHTMELLFKICEPFGVSIKTSILM